MNQKSKNIITIALIALIIIAGIVIVSVWGFNKELKFADSQKININVEQQVDESKIKNIVNEILGTENIVQTIEIYKEQITIRARSISEEQRNNIVNKIKENYEFEQTAENTSINTVPATRIRDMYKQYILPFVISAVLIVAYTVIRYYKKGILKVLLKIISIPVVAQLLLFSIIAITRIPVGRFIPVFMILVFVASVWYAMKEIEK